MMSSPLTLRYFLLLRNVKTESQHDMKVFRYKVKYETRLLLQLCFRHL